MIYISGPITGNPGYLAHFGEAELELSKLGYDVYNPAANRLEEDATWSDYMRRDIYIIALEADGLALLPGWETSEGAVLEVQVAKAFGLPVRTIPGWIQHNIDEVHYAEETPAREVFTHPNTHLFKDYPLTDADPDGQELVQRILERKAAREFVRFAGDGDTIPDPPEPKKQPSAHYTLEADGTLTQNVCSGSATCKALDHVEGCFATNPDSAVAITEAEFLGNDGLGNPAGSPADHTTYGIAGPSNNCAHFWVTSATRDGLIKECPNCGETTIERTR